MPMAGSADSSRSSGASAERRPCKLTSHQHHHPAPNSAPAVSMPYGCTASIRCSMHPLLLFKLFCCARVSRRSTNEATDCNQTIWELLTSLTTLGVLFYNGDRVREYSEMLCRSDLLLLLQESHQVLRVKSCARYHVSIEYELWWQ